MKFKIRFYRFLGYHIIISKSHIYIDLNRDKYIQDVVPNKGKIYLKILQTSTTKTQM